jgi:hypothetical protein
MAEIKNYTMNFGCDRPAGLTCSRKFTLAGTRVSAEIHGERTLNLVSR